MTSWNNPPGAGIYGGGQAERHPIANNGLIVGDSDGLFLDCVSNSSQSGVGMITGPDENTLYHYGVTHPFSRPGVIRLQRQSFSATDQGIYTCTIPDNKDNQFIFNVGLYPIGFMG